jgi:hypothetical protein
MTSAISMSKSLSSKAWCVAIPATWTPCKSSATITPGAGVSLTVDEQLAKLRPNDATVLYNLACSYSLTDRLEEAIEALHRALGAGYDEFAWMAKDPDLAAVRKHPLYEKIQAKIKARKSKSKSA